MNVLSEAMPLSEDELRDIHAKHSREANKTFDSQGFDLPDASYRMQLAVKSYLNSILPMIN